MIEGRYEDDDRPQNHEHHEHRPHEHNHEHRYNEYESREHSQKELKIGTAETIVIVIGVALLLMVFYNSVKISTLPGTGTGFSVLPSVSATDIIPSGVPKIYGNELGISYDDVSASNSQKADSTIAVLSKFDNSITLTGADKERYITIASQISCEYCCGANSIIRSDGSAACGCAHSYSMRGLAKYLITKHGSEYTDDEILEELGKWKVLFFPGIHETKAAVLKEKGIETNYINLASNKYRGIEKGTSSSGGMVGGC